MSQILAADLVDLLLQAAFSRPQDGWHAQFLFGPPGVPRALFNTGTEVFYSRVGLAKAALFARQGGPLYLRSLPISEVEGKLTDFVSDTYWAMAPHVWGQFFDGSYASRVPSTVRDQLARLLASCPLLSPTDFPTIYPLVPIIVKADFETQPFFLISAESLSPRLVGMERGLAPTQFPPIASWEGRIERPASWLGIRSPAQSSANRMRNVVMGALALLPHPLERHMFSGRHMFGGSVSFRESVSFLFGRPCTPAMSENLMIEPSDAPWLELLALKLIDSSVPVRRQMRALEYFYRAWPLPEVERFPVLFMALDAVFGDASHHTQAVVDSIGSSIGAGYDVKRLKLLMKLRAAVIHGGAPDVYDSTNYAKYFEDYGQDPVDDLERIAARCLQAVVFEGKQASRRHTYADLLKAKLGYEP
jgi:hypothetical protein